MNLHYPRGGILPDSYGLSLTVFCGEATDKKPVMASEPLMFEQLSGDYGVRRALEGEVPELYSKESLVSSPTIPFSAHVSNKYVRNIQVMTIGELAVGDSIVADGTGKVKKSEMANGTLVIKINGATKTAEVLI